MLLIISAAESNALFIELDQASPGRDIFGPQHGQNDVRFAAAFILALMGSTSAVSSLDAPLHHSGSQQVDAAPAPQVLVAFTSGEAVLAGIALVP